MSFQLVITIQNTNYNILLLCLLNISYYNQSISLIIVYIFLSNGGRYFGDLPTYLIMIQYFSLPQP